MPSTPTNSTPTDSMGAQSARATNRRRRLLVNGPLQSRIILKVSWLPSVALAMTALALGVLCSRLTDEALAAKVELPSLIPIFVTVICFLLVAVFCLIFQALKISHRIAGPMYRLNKTLQGVRAGDRALRANLRQGDFLSEVADEMNEFLDWVEGRMPGDADADADRDAESNAGTQSPTTEPGQAELVASGVGDSETN